MATYTVHLELIGKLIYSGLPNTVWSPRKVKSASKNITASVSFLSSSIERCKTVVLACIHITFVRK